jgi:cytochrome c-type biogenesis protein CcmH/NrfG
VKKEYQILAIFLGILAISGVIIFTGSKTTKTQADPHAGMPPQENQMPPAPDSTQMLEHIKVLESQLTSDPNNYEALVGLGNTYYDMNSSAKAIEYYEKALKINPNDAPVMVDLGAMYRQAGEFDKALGLFNKAIQIDPKLPQAYFNLGMVLRMEKHDAAGAAKAWRKYLELDPNSQARQFLEEQIKIADDSSRGSQ